MKNYPKFFDPQTLSSLQGVTLRARQIVEGLVAGMHRSPFRGFSTEFAEHREYAPGDDLRHVDWKVFGRTDKYYLKQYEDETNLVCHIVIDASESMCYQGPDSPLSKWEYAQCIAAALAWIILGQQDSVGLTVFDTKIRTLLPPSGAASQLEQILETLEQTQPSGETSLGPILHELAGRLRRRGVVIILSDMFDSLDETLAGLKHFRHRRHDLIVGQVLDAAEIEFPFQRQTMFKGLEHAGRVNTDPRSLRRAYLAEFDSFRKHLQSACHSRQIDYQLLRTDQPFHQTLAHYLNVRGAKP